ncbi:MAG: component of SufBCD complex [Rhodobacter sp.]|nr:component of SufBCD complex [Rhodobacter sp.]MCY4167035.1 component of SufBCD complex [Rhodobacter sp.]MCY4240113.1 component of SufBCD complex [Rhodobacter sp.]
MEWRETVSALIDTRSFSSLWFWIAVLAVWFTMGKRVLGVPVGIMRRAARNDGQAQKDLEDLVRIRARYLHQTGRRSGTWIVAVFCAVLSGLGLTGFLYGVEIAQALFLLVFPTASWCILELVTAARIDSEAPTGEPLREHMWRQRNRVQLVGLLSALVSVAVGLRTILATAVIGG